MNIFPHQNELVDNSFYNPIYLMFGKPITVTNPKTVPILAKAMPLPFMWGGFVPEPITIIAPSRVTEESYIVRSNEGEMRMRIVEILSGGIYSFLKKEGLLRESKCGVEKTFERKGMELDDWFRRLTEGKDVS